MWPLTGPSALKPSLVGVSAFSACAPPTSSVGGSRPHRARQSLCSRRVSLDVSRLSLDGRRSSLSAWPSPVAIAAATLSTSPSASDLCLQPFGLPWAFPSTLDTHPEPDSLLCSDAESSGTPTPRHQAASDSVSSVPTDGPAPQQVTRHNFHLALPLLARALEECTFFALDCEFTGLSPQAPHFSELYDDAADRYNRVLSSSQQFAVMQLGLSMFVRDPETGDYSSRTFNFSVFPKPSGPNDRRFLCQASSLEFLAAQGFDFNRWIYDGIPYLQLAARDRHFADLAQACMPAPATPSPSSPDALNEFAATGGFSQVLEIIRRCAKPVVVHNGLADLVYTLQQFACPLPESWEEFKPLALSWFTGGVYDTRVLASHTMTEAQLPGMFHDLTLSQVNASLAPGGSVEQALSTRTASEEAAQLPTVSHAPGYALYPDGCSRVCAAGALTATSEPVDPVHGVAAVEPACLMASSVPSTARSSSSASTSHSAPIHEAGYDAYLTGAVFAKLARAAELLVPHASTSSSSSSASCEHQDPHATSAGTGSDSELDNSSCGSSACSDAAGPTTPCPGSPRSTASSSSAPVASTSSSSRDDDAAASGPLAALHPWRGRLHSMRADVPYLHLHGADPLPHRPHVFYLSNLPLHTKVSTVAARFLDAGLGKVRVVMLGQPADASMMGISYSAGVPSSTSSASSSRPAAAASSATSKSAFVQLLQPELADQVLAAVKNMGVPWKAMQYADYHASKQKAASQQQAVQNNIVPATITVQAVPQQPHHHQQPKYKLVKVPEEEQQQQQQGAGKGRVLGVSTKPAPGQQSVRQKLTPTPTPVGEGAPGSAAPKRYITVMRKVANNVLAPMQQSQGQGKPAPGQGQGQVSVAPQASASLVQAECAEEAGTKQVEDAGAVASSAPSASLTTALPLAGVPPPPPPPPRTPPRALAAV